MTRLKILFFIIYILFLSVPLITFVINKGFDSFQSNPFYALLRLIGLIGVTLLFIQLMLGGFMNFWRRFLGTWVFRFHITQGIVAYFIILSHPLFYFLLNLESLGITKAILSILPDFSDQYDFFITLGRIGIILLTIGVIAGIFRTRPFISRHWRFFHRANYISFTLILIHSYLIGTDTKTAPFIFLYPIFIVGLIASVIYKLKRS